MPSQGSKVPSFSFLETPCANGNSDSLWVSQKQAQPSGPAYGIFQGSRSREQLLLYVVRIFELARCAGCAGEERASCWTNLAISEAY